MHRFAPVALALLCAFCRSGRRDLASTATHAEADRYIHNAVRRSSEGVILLPSRKATTSYDSATLADLAQQLRTPLAQCFLERAVETMERGVVDGEETFVRVPEGQAKVRARLGADGTVVRVEILETGFLDVVMEECVLTQVKAQRFPPPGQGNLTYIDVVYWVSLGFNARANTADAELTLRREQARAGVRAKRCLQGRVGAGEYRFDGLNLVGREGRTLINRVNANDVPADVSSCVAQALKGLVLPAEREAFVRPVTPEITMTVRADGEIVARDEDWLRVLELEQQAQREALREELAAEQTPPAPASSSNAATKPGVSFGAATGPAGSSTGQQPRAVEPNAAPPLGPPIEVPAAEDTSSPTTPSTAAETPQAETPKAETPTTGLDLVPRRPDR